MTTAVDFFNPTNIHSQTASICLKKFCQNGSGLNYTEFIRLCKSLFRKADGTEYDLNDSEVKEIFSVFDKNKDGLLDEGEFQFCWDKWIQIIVQPKSALLIVDVQNDFISGTLSISQCPAKEKGEEVVEPINALLNDVRFNSVYYSMDWHPENHISFIENVGLRQVHESSPIKQDEAKMFDEVVFAGPPIVTQRLWPAHCVQGSWGAELHPNLKLPKQAVRLNKGMNPNVDSYSAFWDNQKLSQTELHEKLQAEHITDLYLCGLALDYCVGHSALHALEHGYRTIMVRDCIKSLDFHEADHMRSNIIQSKGIEVDSVSVDAMVQGLDRSPKLAYHFAMTLKSNYNNEKC